MRTGNLREVARQATFWHHHLPASLKRDAFTGRWTRRQWAHASLFATLGALLAALVPGFSIATQEPGHTPLTTMSLSLPPLRASRAFDHVADRWQLVTVEQGQTLGSIFEQLDIPATTMHKLLEQPGAKDALTRMKPGTQLGSIWRKTERCARCVTTRGDTQRVELAMAATRSSRR